MAKALTDYKMTGFGKLKQVLDPSSRVKNWPERRKPKQKLTIKFAKKHVLHLGSD